MTKDSESGYILSSVLLISFLIISLLLGVFVVVFFNYKLDIKRFNKKKLELACYSAVQKHISTHSKDISSGAYVTSLDSCNVKLSFDLKGVFYFVSAEAKKSEDSVKVTFLLNRAMSPEFENALILSRTNITPSVAGESKITGDILMSNNHISQGTVYGLRNSTGQFHFGVIKQSNEIKVKLFKDTLAKKQFDLMPDSLFYKYSGTLVLTAGQLDSLHNVFVTGDVIISGQSVGKRSLDNVKIIAKGKVVISPETIMHRELEIHCDSSAEIGSKSDIENLLIAAKKTITIAADSKFQTVQFCSEKDIECEQASFNYPSVLCVYADDKDKNATENQILMKNSVLNGSALLVCSVTGLSNNRSKIVIDEKSTVQGIIYSENFAEIHGTVVGSVYVNNLWYYVKPTEYQNWLINLNIDRGKLPASFLLPVGLAEDRKYKTVVETWIY